jgi:hypothetical protein
MRRTTKLRTASAASIALALAIGSVTPALADTLVSNDLATAGDTTLAAGASGKAKFHLIATNDDNRTGCNASSTNPVMVTLSSSNTNVVAFSAGTTLSLTDCGPLAAKEIEYTVKAGAPKDATTTISGTASGGRGGTFTNDGFVVKVAAPSDTTKPTASHTITAGASAAGWFKASPVTVEITGSDETLLHSIEFSLNGVPGSVLAAGGVKTAKVPVTASAERRHTLTYSAKDGAGNESVTGTVDFGIDTSAPSLSGAPDATGRNTAGWYQGPVSVKWTASDTTSGLAAGVPTDSLISGEGRNKTASTSVSDRAGHTTEATSSPSVNIDGTAPSITGQVVKSTTDRTARPFDGTSPDNKGWYSSPALVAFTCADPALAPSVPGSGVTECSDPESAASNGAGQTISGSTEDAAGNTRSGAASGINVDMAAPTTTSALSCGTGTGFCRSIVTVDLTASDVLSGVKEIRYSTNGGDNWQTANGASKAITIPLSGTGKASVTFQAVDHAGNVESAQTETIKYDNLAPEVTGTKDPQANDAGWNKADTTVTWTAHDEVNGSGVKEGSISAAQTVPGETSKTGVTVTGSAQDNAGNEGTKSLNVKIDQTPPTIGAKLRNTAGAEITANGEGWFKESVTVDFTCNDALSGVDSCADDVTLSTNDTHSVTGTVTDIAGNSGTAAQVSGIKIDAAKPTVKVTGITEGAIYTLGAVPAAVCTASDLGGSGVVGDCSISLTGGTANGVGAWTYTATARDAAGNVSETTTLKYAVQYRWDGFSQPINDTAHQIGLATSIFKAASTVPAKFQLKNSTGAPVQANTAPQWLTPAKGSAVNAPIDEALYGEVATGGATYSWDATAQQYKYNWGTSKAQGGSYWRIGVKLDDGTVRYVNLGLRS